MDDSSKPREFPFQFTHPVRGATESFRGIAEVLAEFQFTHPVRGATSLSSIYDDFTPVSIHAPREGCDSELMDKRPRAHMFQFTHPVRGATELLLTLGAQGLVSIHAPREGCDYVCASIEGNANGFNSRTP